MSRPVLRILLTIMMYFGVVIALFPYLRGQVTVGVLSLIVGLSMAVVCGLLRCYLTEGDCQEKHIIVTSHRHG